MQPGDIVDNKYEITELIAEGGMGEIFRAYHIRIGREFAIKTLRADMMANSVHVARFFREAQAAAAVGSEHIVSVTDVGTTEAGEPYLVMEYLEGEDLYHLLKKEGAIEPHRAVELVLQACAGLIASHRRGIIHRDLKPANLFLCRHEDGSEWIKILDFGIAKFRDALTEKTRKLTGRGMALGTTYYMAPEQASCSDDLDHRVDVYAMGVLLYELTTGESPFVAKSFPELVLKIVNTAPTPPRKHRPELEPGLEEIILRAMARDRQDRYQDLSDMAFDLAQYAPASRTSVTFTNQWTSAPAGSPPPEGAGGDGEDSGVHDEYAVSKKLSAALGGVLGVVAGLAAALLFVMSFAAHDEGAPAMLEPVQSSKTSPTKATTKANDGYQPTSPLRDGDSPPGTDTELSNAYRWYGLSTILLDVVVTPASAKLHIDGIPVEELPFSAFFPRDGAQHRVEAWAEGYEHHAEFVAFDQDRAVTIQLTPEAATEDERTATTADEQATTARDAPPKAPPRRQRAAKQRQQERQRRPAAAKTRRHSQREKQRQKAARRRSSERQPAARPRRQKRSIPRTAPTTPTPAPAKQRQIDESNPYGDG
jgi:serine/threonine-protein kinase